MPDTNEYILPTVKKVLGISPEISIFDTDLITHINTVLASLIQIGVGPSEGFEITGDKEKWIDFYDNKNLNQIRTYVCLKVRMMFDPPTSSILADAMNSNIKEIEYRIYTESGGY